VQAPAQEEEKPKRLTADTPIVIDDLPDAVTERDPFAGRINTAMQGKIASPGIEKPKAVNPADAINEGFKREVQQLA
jgi:hypothetical protein